MNFLSRFVSWIWKRPKKTILQHLEDIEAEIASLEIIRSSAIDAEKRFVFRLVLYSFILFSLGFIFSYYYYWPVSPARKGLFAITIVLYPVIVVSLRYGFKVYFLRSVRKTDMRLKKLCALRQKMLEEVMEKETYNKAQQILKRFDPLAFSHGNGTRMKSNLKPLADSSTELRQRKSVQPCNQTENISMRTAKKLVFESGDSAQACSATPLPKPRLLRPVLPRERSAFDRLLDALVGDGPDRRFALICQGCASHNGMALQEEFEYLAFRCCYCGYLNPARRARQVVSLSNAPKHGDSLPSQKAETESTTTATADDTHEETANAIDITEKDERVDVPTSIEVPTEAAELNEEPSEDQASTINRLDCS